MKVIYEKKLIVSTNVCEKNPGDMATIFYSTQCLSSFVQYKSPKSIENKIYGLIAQRLSTTTHSEIAQRSVKNETKLH